MARKKSKNPTLNKEKIGPAGVLILAGILLIMAGSLLSWSNKLELLFHPLLAKEQTEIAAHFLPKTITISSINIKAPIKIGGVVEGHWRLADDAVMVTSLSGNLWENNNFVLYAHKRKGLFLNLKKVKIGDKIVLEGLNGKTITYEVTSKEDAKPTEVGKLQSDTANTLILFTCDGLFDQSRLIIKANLISS